jgi:hypothetical protein
MRCDVCKNEYDKTFQIEIDGRTMTFDCFECAIHAFAPVCQHCTLRIIGHGVEANGRMFCSAHCAREEGEHGLEDRALV